MSNELYESAQSSQQPIFADDDDEKALFYELLAEIRFA